MIKAKARGALVQPVQRSVAVFQNGENGMTTLSILHTGGIRCLALSHRLRPWFRKPLRAAFVVLGIAWIVVGKAAPARAEPAETPATQAPAAAAAPSQWNGLHRFTGEIRGYAAFGGNTAIYFDGYIHLAQVSGIGQLFHYEYTHRGGFLVGVRHNANIDLPGFFPSEAELLVHLGYGSESFAVSLGAGANWPNLAAVGAELRIGRLDREHLLAHCYMGVLSLGAPADAGLLLNLPVKAQWRLSVGGTVTGGPVLTRVIVSAGGQYYLEEGHRSTTILSASVGVLIVPSSRSEYDLQQAGAPYVGPALQLGVEHRF